MIAHPKDVYRLTDPKWSKKLYLLVLLAGVALYGVTAQRGVTWQDSGMHQWRVLNVQYHNSLGLALDHPLYIAMCQPVRWLAGQDLPAWMNRLSGLGMAITLANVYLAGFWLTGRHFAALLAAAMLGVAHTAWWLATISETYCWVTAGLTTEVLLLVWLIVLPRWWKLALLALVNGLGVSMHNLALLPLPVYGLVALILIYQRRLPIWCLLPALGGWLAGAGLYLTFVVQQGLASGDWPATIRSALFGEAYKREVLNSNLKTVGLGGLYILLNWPFLSLLPVLMGWWAMPGRVGRGIGSALGAIAAIELIFAVRYAVPDQFMFLLPAYAMLAIGAAVGIDRILHLRPMPRQVLMGLVLFSLAATPLLYALTPMVMDSRGISIRPKARHLPGRDENRYWLTPWKMNENSAQEFAVQSLITVQGEAVILADGMTAFPLKLVQALRQSRPDVHVEGGGSRELGDVNQDPAGFRQKLAGRPLYVTTNDPRYLSASLLKLVDLSPAGPLYRASFRPATSLPASTMPTQPQ